jgi:Tol biopolymer transport system component
MRGSRLWVVAGLLSALSVLAVAMPAQAAFPGTNGKIVFSSDRDGDQDIYTVNPDGSGLTQLTNNSGGDVAPSWSADGNYIVFVREAYVGVGGVQELWYMDANGARQTAVAQTTGTPTVQAPAWSPDNERIVFSAAFSDNERDIWTVTPDGTDRRALTRNAVQEYDPVFSPDGQKVAYTFSTAARGDFIHVMNADGSGDQELDPGPGWEQQPDWSPDGTSITYHVTNSPNPADDGVYVMNADQSGPQPVPNARFDSYPAWSPDGTRLAVEAAEPPAFGSTDVETLDLATGTHVPLATEGTFNNRPDWQRVPDPGPPPVPGYARPKGATPLNVSLVPAYVPCDAPDHEHGPSLAFPSCGPPRPASDYLTVGTADSNGQPAKSIGSVLLSVMPGNPATAEDEADVDFNISLTDVRCRGAQGTPCGGVELADYTGQLQAYVDLRLTDRLNSAPSGPYRHGHTGTVQDFFQMPFTFGCSATADASIGATCSLNTTLDAVLPDAVQERTRAIWQLGRVGVRDGGADGDATTDDFTEFATQGVFIP